MQLRSRWAAIALGILPLSLSRSEAQNLHTQTAPLRAEARAWGPYNVHVQQGGVQWEREIPAASVPVDGVLPFSLSLWVKISDVTPAETLIAGVGNCSEDDSYFLGLHAGRALARYGAHSKLSGGKELGAGWHLLALNFDGHESRLYADGAEVAAGTLAVAPLAESHEDNRRSYRSAAAPEAAGLSLVIGPTPLPKEETFQHFGGDVAEYTFTPAATSAAVIKQMAGSLPDLTMLRFDDASHGWPVQTRAQSGYGEQQDPSVMPHSRAPYSKPVAKPLPPFSPSALLQKDPSTWVIGANWMLAAAPDVNADGAAVSTAGFKDSTWMRATVPGTVLTTMIDRGLYPDPDFGLNNLAIPESLNKQDYWYRVEFATPQATAGKQLMVTFNGINYLAAVWLNGHNLGEIKGAFIRGRFDLTPFLNPAGRNAMAVRIAPPPHPGIPQEQSLLGGPGDNGGTMELDGPTFLATEGWDWIPAIRDRNSGLWQDVVLTATESVQLGDPQVITRLPLPDLSSADVSIAVPVKNVSSTAVQMPVTVSFEGVSATRTVSAAPGQTTVYFTSAEFPQLHVAQPRLWWPNGYGRPELYHLRVTAGSSDHKELTFGIREVTYELSLYRPDGRLRRVEVSPTAAHDLHQQVVDVRHEAMLQRGEGFYAASLTATGDNNSPAVRDVPNEPGLTDLVIKVNGVRIAARGGNWGMDDSRKRVSREHLEPYFRLHRDANVNIIRNWVGQNTEETFYELADEYGLMVWNDFWESTQDYNLEAQDIPLFLANAKDTVDRFRNHPSIVMWCGRNEGVPQPELNQGLIKLLTAEDGTRYYSPGSNRINLRNSGPYAYRDLPFYYGKKGTTPGDNSGFSVELGISSLSTLEGLKAQMAPADQWPISDAWAYHDWHWGGNGDLHSFVDLVAKQFGAGQNLPDFERKVQMLNYTTHRAIFEGFNQHLWKPNSGRMLWMTQPAWPSNSWTILGSDYDTQASFYGVKKACEPLHVQLDLMSYAVTAVNTTRDDAGTATVTAKVFSLTNQLLLTKTANVELKANVTTEVAPLALPPLLAQQGVVLVELSMQDSQGKVISHNIYWLASEDAEFRKLNDMPPARLMFSAATHRDGQENIVTLKITNTGGVASLATKATLLDEGGQRVLPAYYTDNYVSVMPGATETLEVRVPAAADRTRKISVRGWNLKEEIVAVR